MKATVVDSTAVPMNTLTDGDLAIMLIAPNIGKIIQIFDKHAVVIGQPYSRSFDIPSNTLLVRKLVPGETIILAAE